MRVCPVMAVSAVVTFGQADVLVLVFTHGQILQICLQGCFGGGFFWHVLPVPSCIAVCLSGGVLAWDGLQTKRGFVERVSVWCAFSSLPFWRIVLGLSIDF